MTPPIYLGRKYIDMIIRSAVIIFFLLTMVSAVFFTMNAYHAAMYDYNDQGRYFDGVTVHHESAVLGWSSVAILFWGIAGAAFYGTVRKKETAGR